MSNKSTALRRTLAVKRPGCSFELPDKKLIPAAEAKMRQLLIALNLIIADKLPG